MKASETVDYHIKLNWHSIVNLYNQIAQEHDLTQATGYVLLNIDEEGGTPATKIAPSMGMKATSLSRILKKMEDDKLIQRKKDKKDGRMVKIQLTTKGIEKKKIAKLVVRDFNEYIIKHIDREKLQCYYSVMNEITSLTEEYRIKKLA